jgi:hypothetical protein
MNFGKNVLKNFNAIILLAKLFKINIQMWFQKSRNKKNLKINLSLESKGPISLKIKFNSILL